jgi:excisionase family DNA binding protein
MQGMATMIGKLMSVEEAAREIGCSTRHVRKLAEDEIIASEKLHERAIVLYRDSVLEYAKTKQSRGRPRLGFQKN